MFVCFNLVYIVFSQNKLIPRLGNLKYGETLCLVIDQFNQIYICKKTKWILTAIRAQTPLIYINDAFHYLFCQFIIWWRCFSAYWPCCFKCLYDFLSTHFVSCVALYIQYTYLGSKIREMRNILWINCVQGYFVYMS